MKKGFLILLLLMLSTVSLASIDPLPAEEVFQVQVKKIDPNNFAIQWQIKPQYFLYSDRIKIKMHEPTNIQLGTLRLPKPLHKTDRQRHVYTIYRNNLTLPVSVLGERAGETFIELYYQGCADDGFCYPPQTKQIKLIIDKQLALKTVELEKIQPILESQTLEDEPRSDDVESVFFQHNSIMILLIFFGFGLLLSFTPCVLPMIPVLSGIIVGHGRDLSIQKAFFLSLSYVLSMSLTYAIVGAVVALVGSNLQIVMQSTWAISLFSALFVLLAFSMFGYFELKLPLAWQAKLAKVNRKHSNGHYLGAAIMGFLSTLILSPCVTAPLIGALSYIARSGNVVLGSLSLFFLGLGMGFPLLLIGTSAGRWLPHAGHWMNSVKAFFGVLLLAVAITLLERILPNSITMLLWAILFIFSGIYAGAFLYSHTNYEKFKQSSGIILFVYGILILIGASMGNNSPLQPLAGTMRYESAASLTVQPVQSVADLQAALVKAKGKPVMVDFYADWCASCKVMEATTFKEASVISALQDFIILKIDVTENNANNKALLRQYGVIAPPTFLFFNKEGKEVKASRLVGDNNSPEFLQHLNKLQQFLKTES